VALQQPWSYTRVDALVVISADRAEIPYLGVTVERMTMTALGVEAQLLDPFGAEVQLDLSDPASAQVIRDLFAEHALLVFRNQSLSMVDQKRILGYLGPVCDHWSALGYVSNRRAGGFLGNSEVSFHSDNSYTSDPLLGISLHAIDVPFEASSTRFASGSRALEALPDELRSRIQGLNGLNVLATSAEAQVGRPMLEGYPDDCPRFEHPLVITDPISGEQSLYALHMNTAAIVGLSVDESNALLARLYTYLHDPKNVYVHRWRNGDFVIWSNFRVLHARGALDPNHERTLQRVCISNGSPDVYENALLQRIVKGRIGAGMG
jgi:taurine dioxygenase